MTMCLYLHLVNYIDIELKTNTRHEARGGRRLAGCLGQKACTRNVLMYLI